MQKHTSVDFAVIDADWAMLLWSTLRRRPRMTCLALMHVCSHHPVVIVDKLKSARWLRFLEAAYDVAVMYGCQGDALSDMSANLQLICSCVEKP